MFDTLRRIVQEVSNARDLNQALNTIVRRVREALNVDACSVYLLDRGTHELLLMATDGLRPECIGKVRLPISVGIVGLVAERQEPLNLQNSAAHPRYHLFPEKGEEHLKAFLGIPLVRFGEVTGVLAVQDHDERLFGDRDLDFLVTVGAQLAGALTQPMAHDWSRRVRQRKGSQQAYWEGVAGSPGVAIGEIISPFPLASLSSVPHRTSEDPSAEIVALNAAITRVREHLRSSKEQLAQSQLADQTGILDAYSLILDGETLGRAVTREIEAGNWAPGALRIAIDGLALEFEQMADPYLSARSEDIRDLGSWILAEMNDKPREGGAIPERAVLVCDNTGFGLLTEIPTERVVALVARQGSALSHTAIVARTLGIPAVMGLGEFPMDRFEGQEVVVDGYRGRIYPEPDPAVRAEFERLASEEREIGDELRQFRHMPATTPDGVTLPLHVKAGLLADLELAQDSGAEGVGLYRTEIGFMVRTSFPSEQEQYELYREVLTRFSPKPVVMRTLDVGGDKMLPYFPIQETNPFMGWRGIRLTLDHPEIFLAQLRAMLRAHAEIGNLQILLPMISVLDEVEDTLRLLEQAQQELRREGLEGVRNPPLGVMIETPASVSLATKLARSVDFLSIGSNDLTQYTLAADRENRNVARLYDSVHPVMLAAYRQVIEAGQAEGTPVGVCGEMTDDPEAAILLLGMGVDSLSTTAASLPRIKSVIRTLSAKTARSLLELALKMDRASDVRRMVRAKLMEVGLGEILRAGR